MENFRNDLVRKAIEKLNACPNDASRVELYRQLNQGFLLLGVAAIPAGIEREGTVLQQDTSLTVLTTSTPQGGPALLAFTDPESLQARAPNTPYVAMHTRAVLQTLIDQGYDALILNPAGPWAGVPREDVLRILEDAWSDKR